MKQNKVPQHSISTYANNKKAMYAVDENGTYTIVPSSGWRVEEEATKQALLELKRQAQHAYAAVVAGKAAPLFFHMFARRMDIQTLAQATGLFKWRIQRHFRPAIFAKLSPAVLTRYADALGMDVDALQKLPLPEDTDD